MKVDIMLVTKDRPSEVGLLLQSLRTQTHKDWDIYIVDDRSGTRLDQHHFLISLFNRLKLEGHKVFYIRNEVRLGVTKLRRQTTEHILKHGTGELIARLDDDNLLNPDWLERLIKVIESGYDIACGLVPVCGSPLVKRSTKYVKPFIADIQLNEDGSIKYFGDDCGIEYLEDEIIPSPHFRSMGIMKREVCEKVKYEDNLGFCSFREEEFFSFRALVAGFKIGVDTGCIAYHINTPSGGERTKEYYEGLNFNHGLLNDFSKKLFAEHGDFIQKYKEVIK